MEEYVNNEDDDEKEITPENEHEGVIHINITDYKWDTIQDNLNKLIEELPNDTSPVEMEECVNNEDNDKK